MLTLTNKHNGKTLQVADYLREFLSSMDTRYTCFLSEDGYVLAFSSGRLPLSVPPDAPAQLPLSHLFLCPSQAELYSYGKPIRAVKLVGSGTDYTQLDQTVDEIISKAIEISPQDWTV